MSNTKDLRSPASSPSNPMPTRRNPWELQTEHANGNAASPPTHKAKPGDSKSPAATSIRSFLLGLTFGTSSVLSTYLALHSSPLWRLTFFLSALSLFHYIEYQVTTIYNPSSATVAAFLLSSNGRAYNIAHALAFFECGIRWYFFPDVHMASSRAQTTYLLLGFFMMVVGQVTRTTAMAHAGTNFNHVVQHSKREEHVLVVDGIYGWLRHPSYFGFFWWGLGSQIVLGNGVCLLGYAVVLWRFFNKRIQKEENLLIGFFGMDYVTYREKTRVSIPFIK